MNFFKKLYLWSLDTKLYTGLYLIVFVVYISFIYFLTSIPAIEIVTLLEVFGVCIFISLSQTIFLNNYFDSSERLYVLKFIIWMIASITVSVGTAIYGNWFSYTFAYIGLGVFILLSLSMLILGFVFEAESSTKKLNDSLKSYKRK